MPKTLKNEQLMMNNIYISYAYFQILYHYLEQEQALFCLKKDEAEYLWNLSQKNPLEKAPLTLFNQFLKKVENANLSPHLYLDIAHKFELKHYGLVGYISSHA